VANHRAQACPDRIAPTRCSWPAPPELRIGELVDLELDCVHEIPDQVAWLRCRWASSRPSGWCPLTSRPSSWSTGSASTAPQAGRCRTRKPDGPPSSCSLTHGRWVSVYLLRDVLTRVIRNAGLRHTTPQLRHTYATALEVSKVPSRASFGKIRERPLPATSPFELDQGRWVDASPHVS
jgi:hypothetical protein